MINESVLKNISSEWTLFIDRDGVVNHQKHLDYIRNWQEFRFYDGAREAFEIFNRKLGTIIMVTNQRGVARGLVGMEDLQFIHKNMLIEIEKSGGRIDWIYACTEMESASRKPGVGMGLQAIKDFPVIDLSKSIMVGNTLSDMQFGRNLDVALNIFLSTTEKELPPDHPDFDLVYKDLISFAKALEIS